MKQLTGINNREIISLIERMIVMYDPENENEKEKK